MTHFPGFWKVRPKFRIGKWLTSHFSPFLVWSNRKINGSRPRKKTGQWDFGPGKKISLIWRWEWENQHKNTLAQEKKDLKKIFGPGKLITQNNFRSTAWCLTFRNTHHHTASLRHVTYFMEAPLLTRRKISHAYNRRRPCWHHPTHPLPISQAWECTLTDHLDTPPTTHPS